MPSVVTQSPACARYSRLHARPYRVRLGLLALPALLLGFLALTAAPALAAPSWGIEMTHANAYGAQAASCPGGHESLPGEPDCGVDPHTRSGTTFAQESGSNSYTIHVKNTSSGGLSAGAALKCETGAWEGSPTFNYHWLRNGTVIPGAGEAEYTVTAEDEGKALQCEVTGTNASGATSFATKAVQVSPEPATTPPTSTKPPHVTEESGTVAVETKLTCTPGEWTGSPTFAYQWSRNGAPISGATHAEYETTGEDEEASVQCEITATNAGGSVLATNRYYTLVAPAPAGEPPYTEHEPTIPSSSEIVGPVTVADRLPEGLVLGGANGVPAVSGAGWECTIATGAGGFSCAREPSQEALVPGAEYPPLTVRVSVSGEAPVGSPPSGGVSNTASVSGGGAPTALASDPTAIAPAVPFGIQSFTTSVTESLGSPFTQAGGHPFAANATFGLDYR